MFDIGFSELLLFGVIALIVLGPEKLPQAARTAGQWYAKIRRAAATIQSEIEAELDLAETRQQMQKELAKIRQTEADMRREMAELRGNMKAFEHSKNQPLQANAPPAADIKNQAAASVTQNEGSSPQQTSHHKSATTDELNTVTTPPMMTRPWENMWFRLGAYDKARRLPAAPRLPNYQADILLYNQPSYIPQPTQQPNEPHPLPTPAASSQQEATQ